MNLHNCTNWIIFRVKCGEDWIHELAVNSGITQLLQAPMRRVWACDARPQFWPVVRRARLLLLFLHVIHIALDYLGGRAYC